MIDIARIADPEAARRKLTRRGAYAAPELPEFITRRNAEIFGEVLTPDQVVARTIAEVRANGDKALHRFNREYDGRAELPIEVPTADLEAAWNAIAPDLRQAMEKSVGRIRAFHERQPSQSWIEPDELGMFGQLVRPLERVGVYVPAGSAPLPSSLLMVVIPARVAGVEEVIVCSPAGRDGACHPVILAAAHISGVDRVFAVGGAAAIAAMAYGTETVPAVDKVLGPGNLFTSLAKKQVFGDVDIDQLAGPTETMVIADDSASAELVAADLLAQAEHGETSSAILITTSQSLADQVAAELESQLERLPRGAVAAQALRNNGALIVVDALNQAVDLANAFAPEHLCLLTNDPWSLIPSVRNAAGIFAGEQSPEAIGDYTAGPSHVMPTGGSARYASPVNIRDFQKVISIVAANDRAVNELGPATVTFAESEGLIAHAEAVRKRLDRSDSAS